MTVLVRADGGPDIGYGHLVRTGALGEALQSRDEQTIYATTTPEAVRDVCPESVDVVSLPSRDDPEPVLDAVLSEQPDIVFVDAYPVGLEYQQQVRERVPLAVWQDDNRNGVCADIFVNGNLYANDLRYDFSSPEPRTFLGTDYLFLRREIREFGNREPPWRETPVRALVTMGGSDIADLTPTVLEGFDGFELQVDAIVGPGFSDEQEQSIRDIAAEISATVDVVRDPNNLPERMFEADFAVSTASSTTYELLALGTPIVSVPVVDNQEPIARALQENDIASVVQNGADLSAIQKGIQTYVTDASTRRKHRRRGRKLIDGRGTDRIADELVQTIAQGD